MFTPEEAHLTQNLTINFENISQINDRIPNYAENITILEEKLNNLAQKGLIIKKNENGQISYANVPFVIGIFEFNLNNLTHRFLKDVESYIKQAFAIEMINSQIPQMRPIPIDQSIDAENRIFAYDEVKHIIDNSTGPFAVADCICKKGHDIDSTACKKTKIRETCINIGDMGQMYINNKIGKQISKEEALEIVNLCDKEGLVLQTMNAQDPQVICACCGCCCGVLAVLKFLPRPVDFTLSNYFAQINAEKCIGCGNCVNRCQMDAIKVYHNKAEINEARCIGCGLCVTKCSEHAIQLMKKNKIKTPPINREDLYKQIRESKKSRWERVKMLAKTVIGVPQS